MKQPPYVSVSAAFSKGIATQMRPSMLFAIVLPFVIALITAVILLVFAWGPLDNWLDSTAMNWGWFQSTSARLSGWGFATMSDWFTGVLTFVALLAVSGIAGLAAAAILVMPMALKVISEGSYPELQKKGVNATITSLANTIKVSAIFVIGWLVTLPLWLIPFAGIALSLFWGAYAFSHMTRLDAIVEHATLEERVYVLRHYSRGFWLIGLVCAAIALIPFAGFIMPVFSILVCTHYGLMALKAVRAQPPEALAENSAAQAKRLP
ncbi:EI24 domain-containing protein [Advenella mimigardefordensis]|uniref:Putative membrane protein n=1 Tax=Advenella mimigardefordensis (strain DSM 17166 / LMG 22922 / DPN7) TaxID=1247726 RepID=W0PJN3_ADVMD|nr:EI24 domain-containing protein [Advenella mimigardefordensis]AHG65760.1 putative membrane protein [Advenella mimigardefordensis DPN7]